MVSNLHKIRDGERTVTRFQGISEVYDMKCEDADRYDPHANPMAGEETIRERVDEKGDRWTKVYVGGGDHFRNWLSQFVELNGEENVKVEEAESLGFSCFEEAGEKMYRIWVKGIQT
jgi:hypothetical protein